MKKFVKIIAKSLQNHCKIIAKSLQNHCKIIAKSLQIFSSLLIIGLYLFSSMPVSAQKAQDTYQKQIDDFVASLDVSGIKNSLLPPQSLGSCRVMTIVSPPGDVRWATFVGRSLKTTPSQ